MSTFTFYENELKSVLNNISEIISQGGSLSEGYKLHDEAVQIHKEMLVSIDSSDRAKFSTKLKGYADELKSLKNQLDDRKFSASKSSLVGSSSEASRQQMLSNESKINQQNEILLQTLKKVSEIEDDGRMITSSLQSNRQTLEQIHERNTEFKGIVDESQATLKSMQNRDNCHIS